MNSPVKATLRSSRRFVRVRTNLKSIAFPLTVIFPHIPVGGKTSFHVFIPTHFLFWLSCWDKKTFLPLISPFPRTFSSVCNPVNKHLFHLLTIYAVHFVFKLHLPSTYLLILFLVLLWNYSHLVAMKVFAWPLCSQWACGISPSHSLADWLIPWFPPDVQ